MTSPLCKEGVKRDLGLLPPHIPLSNPVLERVGLLEKPLRHGFRLAGRVCVYGPSDYGGLIFFQSRTEAFRALRPPPERGAHTKLEPQCFARSCSGCLSVVQTATDVQTCCGARSPQISKRTSNYVCKLCRLEHRKTYVGPRPESRSLLPNRSPRSLDSMSNPSLMRLRTGTDLHPHHHSPQTKHQEAHGQRRTLKLLLGSWRIQMPVEYFSIHPQWSSGLLLLPDPLPPKKTLRARKSPDLSWVLAIESEDDKGSP